MSYRQLAPEQRYQIEAGLETGIRKRAIASQRGSPIDPPQQVLSGCAGKKDGGGYLMAVSVRSLVHADKAQVCSGELNFIEYNGAEWMNVTERYAPKLNAI